MTKPLVIFGCTVLFGMLCWKFLFSLLSEAYRCAANIDRYLDLWKLHFYKNGQLFWRWDSLSENVEVVDHHIGWIHRGMFSDFFSINFGEFPLIGSENQKNGLEYYIRPIKKSSVQTSRLNKKMFNICSKVVFKSILIWQTRLIRSCILLY